ncbi:outer membrane receptor protein involved in Fe transport [Luteimonas cucumeris]|uniref:Outer membrane receptor protein involved in Fe transport n=1 Tax=Luteimonas cucumeris TaxID=985012 RepID=A0A562L5G9_9GAMM|nr:TonB-dependent receptor [Luteimonas cucumeris]TWI02674.1 outer membrane receptor protein involved in Fe transport [Luteimonas cucumeris]
MRTLTSVQRLRPMPLVAAIAGILWFAAPPVALAQQAQADSEAADKPANRVTTLGGVVVTADKREENINRVASSISVVAGEQLEKINATQLSDYADYIPGFQVVSLGSPGKTAVSMRGIAPLSSGSTIGTYIDETPVGSSGLYQRATQLTLDLLPYDIQRVEVLRGPQGTLYGAGSMGGLLKYVTREPDLDETEFRIGAGLSSVADGETGNTVRFGANLPITKDRLGLRLSYTRNEIPGYIDNAVNGEEDINDGVQTSARAALLWQGDDVSLKLSAMRQTADTDNNAYVALDPVTGRELDRDLSNRIWNDELYSRDIDYYAATVDWDLGWADFTSATGYSDTSAFIRQDTTVEYGQFTNLGLGLPDPGSSFFDNMLSLKKTTQEFRLTSKSGSPFEWLVGAFYTKEEGDNSQFIALRQLDGSALPAPFDAIAGTLAYLTLPTDYKETAVFANVSYHFTDKFKLGAGVRYAENDQNFSQNVTEGLLLPIETTSNTSSENVFNWSLSPQFQLTEDTLLYGKIATGYQPGGPNVVLPGIPPSVDSSTLTSYELGMKALFAGNRLQLDVAAYRIDWQDIQIITFFNGNSGLANGGKARSQGLEFSLLFNATSNLQLGFNGNYTDATLSEDLPPLFIPSGPVTVQLNNGLEGDVLPYIPKTSWSATADYYIPMSGNWSGNVGAGLRWVDGRPTATSERQVITTTTTPPVVVSDTITPPIMLGSYISLDLYAGISNDQWSIRAYMKNATDERAYQTIADKTNALTNEVPFQVGAPIRPRTIGLEVDYRF